MLLLAVIFMVLLAPYANAGMRILGARSAVSKSPQRAQQRGAVDTGICAKAPRGVPCWPWFHIAKCEQGMYGSHGFLGVKWWAYSQSYEGGYGFRHETWDQFRYPGMPDRANRATPAQQTRVAMRLRAFFGNYSSWPACHRRLGL